MANIAWNQAQQGFDFVPPSGVTEVEIYCIDEGSSYWYSVGRVPASAGHLYGLSLTKGKKKGKGVGRPGGVVFDQIDFINA